jgi:tRNA threonylcarbamoyladenosine biosynthesis protein TsaE
MVRATLPSPAVTGRGARALAPLLPVPALVTLEGELGTGKTTLVRGLLRALGVRGAVTSPSFTLAQSYHGRGGLALHHLDLYRLGPGADVELFAWDDYLGEDAVVFVEWPEAGRGRLPAVDVGIRLLHDAPRSRRIEVRSTSALEERLVVALRETGAADVGREPAS